MQFKLKSDTTRTVELARLGPDLSNSYCTAIQLEEDEFVSNLDVWYSTYIEAAAVLLSTGRFERWGASGRRPKNWRFNSEYELIGLYGASDDQNVNSLGIIVFKADQCRADNKNVDDVATDETSSDDSNDLDDISRAIRDSFSSYDSSVFPENNTESNLGVALGSIVPKTEKQKSDYTALGIALACMLILLALLMGLTVLLWSGKDRQAAKIIDVKEE